MGLKSIELSHDPLTGKSKGYAFIEFHLTAHAEACQRAMDGFLVAGRSLATSSIRVPLSLSRESLLLHAVPIAMLLPRKLEEPRQTTGSSSTNCVGASGADFTPKCLVIAPCHLSVRVSAITF